MKYHENKNLEFERIKILFQMGSYGLYSNLLLSVISVLVLWKVVSHAQLFSWLSTSAIFNILFLYFLNKALSRFGQIKFDTLDIDAHENYFYAGILLSALEWTLLLILPINENAHLYFFAMVFIIGTAVVVAIGTLSLSSKSSVSFVFIIMTSFIYRIILTKLEMWEIMSLVAFFLMVILIILSQHINKVQINSLMYRLTNANLVDELFKTSSNYADLNEILQERLKKEQLISEGLLEAFQFQLNILTNSISGTFVLDQGANFIQTNQVGASILGYSKEELFGMSSRTILDNATFRKMIGPYNNLRKKGTSIIRREIRVIKKDKTRADCIFNASPIYKGGKIIGAICSAEDITERKRIEVIKKIRIEILEMLAQGKGLSKILKSLLLSFRKLNPDASCAIVMPDIRYNNLVFIASLGLPRPYRKLMETYVSKQDAILPCMEAVRHNKTVIQDDIDSENTGFHFFKNPHIKEFRSFISHPVTDENGKSIAVFEVYMTKPQISIHISMSLIEEFIELARVVLERKTIENELVSRNKKLSTLYKMSSVVLEEIELDKLFEKTRFLVSELHEYSVLPRIKIFINNNEQLELFYDSKIALNDPQNPCFDVKAGECLCGLCFENGEVIVSENSNFDMLHTKKDALMEPHGHIVIPLFGRDKINGVLCLYTKPMKHTIEDKDKFFFLSIGRQIGLALENASLYNELKKLSLNDPLTGLANRYRMKLMIQKLLPLAKRTNKPVSIALLDIDHFKNYNDQYGHSAGDRLLVDLANILTRSVREEDLAVRYGGEEFLMIFANTDLKEAQIIVDRIRIETLKTTGISISAGLAIYNHTRSFDELIELADKALYEAKNTGRNRIIIAENSP